MEKVKPSTHALRWLPSLYYYQALPFFLVTSVASVLYKQLGVSNAWLALATSVFYFPWVIKPLGGPIVEARGSLSRWTVATQGLTAAFALLAAAATAHASFLYLVSALFLAIAISSTFHDIACEGIYLHALSPYEQAWYVGWRATFFRLGWLSMQGLFVAAIGALLESGRTIPEAWRLGFLAIGAVFALFACAHAFTLPKGIAGRAGAEGGAKASYLRILTEYFRTPDIVPVLAFLLLFRLGESQIQKLAIPFFLDPLAKGGLGLSTKQVGLVYGSLGPLFLSLGGLTGGWLASRDGLRKWFVPMAVGLNVPHALYGLMAIFQPTSIWTIAAAVNVEQFFYGFGFTAYLLFLIETSRRGPYPTAGYAVGTGLMAFGMMLPGAWSGWLQEHLGYSAFFAWTFLCTVPSVWATVVARRRVLDGRPTSEHSLLS